MMVTRVPPPLSTQKQMTGNFNLEAEAKEATEGENKAPVAEQWGRRGDGGPKKVEIDWIRNGVLTANIDHNLTEQRIQHKGYQNTRQHQENDKSETNER